MNHSLPFQSVITLGTLALISLAPAARANLGSFEAADGYGPFLNEVTGYNAGQYGLANGGPGGSATAITPGTGLWYGISGVRYPATSTGGGTSYATGHQFFDRLAPSTAAQALVITTNSEGWSGPTLSYGYHLDSRDLGGISPAATAGGVINMSFWWCPLIQGTGEGGGLGAGTIGDTVEMLDSSGNVGFKMGLIQPGTTTDYVGYDNGAGFVQTTVKGYSGGYSQWNLSLDLAGQKITASYFDAVTLTSYNFLTAANLNMTMSDFTQLRFASTPGVTNAKNLALDDFQFKVRQSGNSVPEPGGAALLFGMAAVGAGVLRRRRK